MDIKLWTLTHQKRQNQRHLEEFRYKNEATDIIK